mmetsp:Transcript_21930/g.61292  ORF Transcript_21930/g.61292 Transcript_21930/m.61292 type:complete len:399 (-) Transcript_21930:154-1350(-)
MTMFGNSRHCQSRGEEDSQDSDDESVSESLSHFSQVDAAGVRVPAMPASAKTPYAGVRAWLLRRAGVNMSKDGRSVFNYNPGMLTRGCRFLGVLAVVPSICGCAFHVQMLYIYMWSLFWVLALSDSLPGQKERGRLDEVARSCNDNFAPLTRFVLGLYISLSLTMTYYRNRSFFGTVFGSSLGFSQMVAAWVRSPDDQPATRASARAAQQLLVRWVNAAYRLMVLEVRGVDEDTIGWELIERKLLSEPEWKHIANFDSRCTHIYQWTNNVLLDLVRAGYIPYPLLLDRMNHEVDAMRAANVWGLPSLPIPYTLLITAMVKINLFFMACSQAGNIVILWPTGMPLDSYHAVIVAYAPVLGILSDIFLQNFLYQGMLDLHGWIYSPNGGCCLGICRQTIS